MAFGRVLTRSYSPIIPNSQLIVVTNSARPSAWLLEMFVNPTSKIMLICVVVVVVLIALFVAILVLQIRESRKDHEENKLDVLY